MWSMYLNFANDIKNIEKYINKAEFINYRRTYSMQIIYTVK